MRPKPPKTFLINADGYHEHNRYFNQAEKVFDSIERELPKLFEGIKTTVALYGSEELLFEECGYNIGCLFFDFVKNTGFMTNSSKEDTP